MYRIQTADRCVNNVSLTPMVQYWPQCAANMKWQPGFLRFFATVLYSEIASSGSFCLAKSVFYYAFKLIFTQAFVYLYSKPH